MEKEFVSYELAKLLTNIGMNKDRKTSLLAFISKNDTIYMRSASYAPQDSIDTSFTNRFLIGSEKNII